MTEFDSNTGYLPAGVHIMTWADFQAKFAWNSRRAWLCGGLYRALNNLRCAGCKTALIDGSFVTSRDQPGDYDAAFDPSGINGTYVDPVLLRHTDGRRAMKAKYLGDIFPWGFRATTNGPVYKEFFQTDRDGIAKGVVEIDLGTLP